jgi:hypothetical protein
MQVSRALGVTAEALVKPLPCFEPEERDLLRASLLWDGLFPDLDDFAVAVRALR